mgnify:CR=1 FL=1
MLGLDNAGKTTILYQFLMNEVVHTSPTIGSNVEEVTCQDIIIISFNTQQVVWNNIHFVMWDLGGQESLRTAWNTYYSNTEFIILVWLLLIPLIQSSFPEGDRQYRQRENICVERGVAQNAGERRAPQGVCSRFCQ